MMSRIPLRPPTSYTAGKEQLPLHGITVLDLTLARAGPTCVRHLADWGANIIRIEPPEAGSEDLTGRREGFDFQNLHRNKRMIRLNLKAPEGHAAFMRLVEKADVIVENMRAAVKHRLKVSYDDVRKVNPRIVYGSISGFGQTGPYGKRAGVDQIVQGMGGLMSITGLPGQGPVRVGLPIADLTAGNLLALGDHDGALRPHAHRRRQMGAHEPARSADLHARLPGFALARSRRRSPSRPATIIRPAFRRACSRRATAISTSPRPRRGSSRASARRSASRSGRTRTEWNTRGEAERRAQGDQRGDQRDHAHQACGALGGALRGSRRAVRADLHASTRCSPIRR